MLVLFPGHTLRPTAQNFALFFPFPPPFRSLCVSLGVFSLNFGGLFEGRDPRCAKRHKQSEMVAGDGKKREILGPPPFGTPPFAEFLSSLAWAKVRELHEELQAEARRAWLRRWQRLLACTAAKAKSMSLLGLVPGSSNGVTPSVHEGLGMRDGLTVWFVV